MSVRLESVNTEGLYHPAPWSQNADYTVAGWFYAVTSLNGAFFELVYDPATGALSEDWCLNFSAANPFNIRVHAKDVAGADIDFNEGSNVFSVAAWYYIAMVRSGSSLIVRARPSGGSSSDHISITASVAGRDAAQRFNIGRRRLSENGNNVRVAYVRAWAGSALSNAQLNAEAVSPTAIITTNLWGSWKLTSHTDLSDSSGNGRTLTAGGTLSTEGNPPDVIVPAAQALVPYRIRH